MFSGMFVCLSVHVREQTIFDRLLGTISPTLGHLWMNGLDFDLRRSKVKIKCSHKRRSYTR